LQFRSRASAIIELNNHGNCASKLNSLRTMLRVSLGEVCHTRTMSRRGSKSQITEAPVRIPGAACIEDRLT
jgi:hypothetical protein